MTFELFTVAVMALIFSAQVNAHAAIAPALGVSGNLVRADVKRPSAALPCGLNANIAANIDKSTPVVAQADGSFVVTVTDFNPGRDGSRSVSLSVDATGSGKNFVAGNVTTNGVAAPKTVGSDQVTAVLPPGTTCTGGISKNLCLASFKTTAGFGNCVVVKQDIATASMMSNAVAATKATAISSVVATSSAAVASTGTAVAAEVPSRQNDHQHHERQAGTRAARALRAGFQASEQFAKRTVLNWIWA